MSRTSAGISGQWLQIAATVLFAAALTVLLILGMQRANELQSASSALQLTAELSTRPAMVHSELTLIQRGLETTTYVGEPLRSIATLRESSNQAFNLIAQQLRTAQLADEPEVAAPLAAALNRWQSVDHGLESLNKKRAGELYTDSSAGSELAASGKQLKALVDNLLSAQAQNLQVMSEQLEQLSTRLHADVADSGRSLRALLLGGTAVAALLLALMLYYAYRARMAAAAASSAQRQVANILNTVREGLFLLGRDLRLGATCSASLTQLLRLTAPAGMGFEDVLRPLVDENTRNSSNRSIRSRRSRSTSPTHTAALKRAIWHSRFDAYGARRLPGIICLAWSPTSPIGCCWRVSSNTPKRTMTRRHRYCCSCCASMPISCRRSCRRPTWRFVRVTPCSMHRASSSRT